MAQSSNDTIDASKTRARSKRGGGGGTKVVNGAEKKAIKKAMLMAKEKERREGVAQEIVEAISRVDEEITKASSNLNGNIKTGAIGIDAIGEIEKELKKIINKKYVQIQKLVEKYNASDENYLDVVEIIQQRIAQRIAQSVSVNKTELEHEVELYKLNEKLRLAKDREDLLTNYINQATAEIKKKGKDNKSNRVETLLKTLQVRKENAAKVIKGLEIGNASLNQKLNEIKVGKEGNDTEVEITLVKDVNAQAFYEEYIVRVLTEASIAIFQFPTVGYFANGQRAKGKEPTYGDGEVSEKKEAQGEVEAKGEAAGEGEAPVTKFVPNFKYPTIGFYAFGVPAPGPLPRYGIPTMGTPVNNANMVEGQQVTTTMMYMEGQQSGQLVYSTSGPVEVKMDPLTSMISDEKRLKADFRSTASKFNGLQNRDRENQVRLQLDMLAIFADYITAKHVKWGNDLANLSDIRSKILDVSLALKALPERAVERKRFEEQLVYQVTRLARAYSNKSNNNFAAMKNFFVKRGRRGVRNILRYLRDMAYVKDQDYLKRPDLIKDDVAMESAKAIVESYMAIEERYNFLVQKISESNNVFYVTLNMLAASVEGNYNAIEEEKKADLESFLERTYDTIRLQEDKINSFYQLRYSLIEMVLDAQFYIMYFLKAARALFAYVALFLSTRIFVPIYEETVYDEKKDPPSLWKYLLIFLAFDFSLNVFLLVLIYLIKYLFKNDDNSFVIDSYLINNHCYDYAVSILITLFVAFLVGRVIIQKKYFKYKYEGMRAIRAYEQIVFYIALVNTAIPYYLMF